MKRLTFLSQTEWQTFFSERLFNPPLPDADFVSEFDDALDRLQSFLEQRFAADEYYVHPYQNQSRFLDVVFQSEAYLNAGVVQELQDELRTWPQPWMVALGEACYLFVTADALQAYDPTGDNSLFRDFCAACRRHERD
jgi:hypothetical protein